MYADSLGDLIDCVRQLTMENRCYCWFRGQKVASWNILPSIWRSHTDRDERNFTHRFRSRASIRIQNAPKYDEYPAWLSLMQHYGLPTRLLDWTRSPLIAAYFAVEGYQATDTNLEDAAIWALQPFALNSIQGFEDFTPAIDAYSCSDMVHAAFNGKNENDKIMAVMASETDTRMFVQQGCFTVHSNKMPLDKQPRNSEYLTKIIVRKEFISRVASEMDLCSFRRGDIFPDLGNLALELKDLKLVD